VRSGADLDDAGVVAGDPPAAGTGLAGDFDRDGHLFVHRRSAHHAREVTVHPDRVLVDLFGVDLPGDVLDVDVDAQRLADLLDGDVGVVVRADIDPSVPR